MDIHEFVLKNEVEFSDSLITAGDVTKVEKNLKTSFGKQLKEYILTYGYLAYKFSELYGINARQFLNSDMVKQTIYLHTHFQDTLGYIAIENQGEGDYYLVDENDNIFEYDTELKTLIPKKEKLFDYIIQRFKSIS